MDNFSKNNIPNQNQLFVSESEDNQNMVRSGASINPNLSSVHEVILLYLKELSFYLLQLKDMGITNEVIKQKMIHSLFSIITNVEYTQENFQYIISSLYEYINQAKIIYEKSCFEQNKEILKYKSYFKYSKSFDLTYAIRKGEKYFLKKASSFTQEQKDFYDIFLFLGKSISIKLIELQNLGKDNDDAFYAILFLLSMTLPKNVKEINIKEHLQNIINTYYELVKQVFKTQVELYGESKQCEVSFSTKPGHAILVSGSDYKKLENVLKATEGTQINVYTHGFEMLMAHTFEKFRKHPNLQGHYGSSTGGTLIDFASFPGAILMTKASLQKVEYLYRGRLYTLDPIAPPGVVIIKDNNFKPLIKSAMEAKGFVHPTSKPSLSVGFNIKDVNQKIDLIVEKMDRGEIKNLYVIGLLNTSHPEHKEYFDHFYKLLPKDAFVLSLSHKMTGKNILHFDSFYDYTLVYKILKEIRLKSKIENLNISMFLTKCDKHTISNLLYFRHIGIKNLFMCKCPSNLISPTIISTLQQTFEIKEMSNPAADLSYTLGSQTEGE